MGRRGLSGGLLFLLSFWLGFCQGFMDDADGDFDSGGDGADGFSALAAGQDRGALVVVDHRASTAESDTAVSPARTWRTFIKRTSSEREHRLTPGRRFPRGQRSETRSFTC